MAQELDLSAASDAAAETQQTDEGIGSVGVEQQSQTQVAGDNAAASTESQQQQQAAEWSLRNELQSLGFQGQFSDDKAAFGALVEQLRQQRAADEEARRIAAFYQANQQTIQSALAAYQQAQQQQQQAATQAASTGEKNWWQVPDWNPQNERFLRTDEKGNIVPVLGADPALGMKYQQYRDWQRTTFENLLRDPIGTLKPGLEQLIEAKAKELIQQSVGQYDERQFANQYVSQQQWMYQADQQGRRMLDAQGRPVLSPAGQRFAEHVRYAETLGIKGAREQQALAERLTQLDALTAFYQQNQPNGSAANGSAAQASPTPEQVNDALKKNAVKGGAHRLPGSGAQNGAGQRRGPDDERPRDVRLGLGDRLNKRLREAGISQVA